MPHREKLCRLVTDTGGAPSSLPFNAEFLIVDPNSDTGRSIIEEYISRLEQLVPYYRWIAVYHRSSYRDHQGLERLQATPPSVYLGDIHCEF
ncbi:hypothetical protein BDV93DRAFT_566851 [Ceratobasidium sp. AG-I]|nr:hypothetical protein BDV93DRAFT_566851 [Ceratobasidium sp. AG-I]